MKSKASIKSHPLHPMLIAFPIAFLTGAVVADVAALMLNWQVGWLLGYYLSLAGVISGAIAAVPGLIDYFSVIPPYSSAKVRATVHMVVNATALLLFTVALGVRTSPEAPVTDAALILEVLALAFLFGGGWLGGTLVYRNQIGVDHRYAEAGRWKEEGLNISADGWVRAATTDELKPNQMKLLHIGESRIVLARTEQGYAAFDDHCTHRGGSLADGTLTCGIVQCPWHGSQFDVETGQVKNGPAPDSIATYAVEVHGNEVYVNLNKSAENFPRPAQPQAGAIPWGPEWARNSDEARS